MSVDIVDLLLEPQITKICAPMVRYSKLQFRTLVRKYNCDLCYTPMILADSFLKSSKARDNEFTTNEFDKPLIVQFAANNVDDFVKASELIAPYSDGVDLNCGCPQRWAMKDGYGADLLKKPDLIKSLVYEVRNKISKPFSVSIKIRLLKDIRKTVELCRIIEHTGASFITVHARTPDMRNEPIDLENLNLVRNSVTLPVVANGGVKSLEDAESLYSKTNCNGVMVAGAILTNPAIFEGHKTTPLICLQDWLDITTSIPTSFVTMHHHFVFMLEKILNKKERLAFNNLNDENSVHEFLQERFNITPKLSENYKLTNCKYNVIPKTVLEKTNFVDEVSNIGLNSLFI